MKRNDASSLVWGMVLISLGIGFLLDTTHVLNFSDFISKYWPIALVLIGVGELVEGKRTSALLWIILGIAFQLSRLDVITGSIWSIFWALVLIWIGISVITRTSARRDLSEDDSEHTSATSIFSGTDKKIVATNFKSASVNAVFGGSKIDLRKAKLSDKGAVVDVLVLFGGAEILVPEDWIVKMEAVALFGGSEDKRKSALESAAGRPVLRIRGTVLFGGIEIKD